jgi:hypothetical protein
MRHIHRGHYLTLLTMQKRNKDTDLSCRIELTNITSDRVHILLPKALHFLSHFAIGVRIPAVGPNFVGSNESSFFASAVLASMRKFSFVVTVAEPSLIALRQSSSLICVIAQTKN